MEPSAGEEPSDYDAFLQAFSKPTQIYRYLKCRHKSAPLFLHRNLSYMQTRQRKTHRRRNETGSAERVCASLMPAPHGGHAEPQVKPCTVLLESLRGRFCEEILQSRPSTAQVAISLVCHSVTDASSSSAGEAEVVVKDYLCPCTWTLPEGRKNEGSSVEPSRRVDSSEMLSPADCAVVMLSSTQTLAHDLLLDKMAAQGPASGKRCYLQIQVTMETKFLPPRRPAKRVPRSPARARVAGSSESDQASDTRKVTRKSSRERAPVLSPRSAALQRPSTRSTAAASEVTPQTRTRSSAPRHTSAAGCASPPSVVSGVHRTRSRSGPVVDQRSKSSLPDFTLTRKAGERPVKISKGSPSSFRELRNLALEGQPDHSALKQAAKGVNAMKTKRTPLASKSASEVSPSPPDSESEDNSSDPFPVAAGAATPPRRQRHMFTARVPLLNNASGSLLPRGAYELVCMAGTSVLNPCPTSASGSHSTDGSSSVGVVSPRHNKLAATLSTTDSPLSDAPSLPQHSPRLRDASLSSAGSRQRSDGAVCSDVEYASVSKSSDGHSKAPATNGKGASATGRPAPSVPAKPDTQAGAKRRHEGSSSPAPRCKRSFLPNGDCEDNSDESRTSSECYTPKSLSYGSPALSHFKDPVCLFLSISWPEGEPDITASQPDSQAHHSGVPPVPALPSISSRMSGLTFPPVSRSKVVFNFVYNGASLQQTVSKLPFTCPWCSRDCRHIVAFVRHLRASHPRFSFNVLSESSCHTINVQVNDSYDRVYSGDPHELFCMLAFRAGHPQRRHQHTKVWVARPAYHRGLTAYRSDSSYNDDLEFTDIKESCHSDRVYFHSRSSIPCLPAEMEEDSEDEHTPPWLLDKTKMMLDEFSDVNRGEKAVMNLWNNFTLEVRPLADSQVPEVCMAFVEASWKAIQERNLSKNLLLHFANLRDFGLLSPAGLHQCYMRFTELCHTSE